MVVAPVAGSPHPGSEPGLTGCAALTTRSFAEISMVVCGAPLLVALLAPDRFCRASLRFKLETGVPLHEPPDPDLLGVERERGTGVIGSDGSILSMSRPLLTALQLKLYLQPPVSQSVSQSVSLWSGGAVPTTSTGR